MQFSCDLIRPWVNVSENNIWRYLYKWQGWGNLKKSGYFLFEIWFDKHVPQAHSLRCSLCSEGQHQHPSAQMEQIGESCHCLLHSSSLHLKGYFSELPELLWSFLTLHQFRPYSTLSCTLLVSFLSSQHKLQSSREREPLLRKMSPSDCCVGVEGGSWLMTEVRVTPLWAVSSPSKW